MCSLLPFHQLSDKDVFCIFLSPIEANWKDIGDNKVGNKQGCRSCFRISNTQQVNICIYKFVSDYPSEIVFFVIEFLA